MQGPSNSVWLHRYTVLTVVATFCLIVAGALVTSNAAGDSVPTWPLAEDNRLPPRDWGGGILYEYGHRMAAGVVALLSIGLAVWLWRSEPRSWVRRLGYVGMLAVVGQGLVGGIRVLAEIRPAMAVLHAALAQVFFCIIVVLAVVTAKDWDQEMPPESADRGGIPLFHLAAATMVAIFFQSLLGAGLRHGALTILPHAAAAVLVAFVGTLLVARVLLRHGSNTGLRRSGLLFAWLLAVQMALGLGAFAARFMSRDLPLPIGFASAHTAVGAVLLAESLVLVLRCRRISGVLGTPLPVAAGPQVARRAI